MNSFWSKKWGAAAFSLSQLVRLWLDRLQIPNGLPCKQFVIWIDTLEKRPLYLLLNYWLSALSNVTLMNGGGFGFARFRTIQAAGYEISGPMAIEF